MPPYEWGVQSTPYSPRPDLVAAAKVRDYNKSLSVPRNNITTIDAGRMQEVDDLYKVTDFPLWADVVYKNEGVFALFSICLSYLNMCKDKILIFPEF